MKRLGYVAVLAVGLLTGCGGGSQPQEGGVQFKPEERRPQMSEEERSAAIARVRAEASVDPEVVFNSKGVKMSVLPPAPDGDRISETLALRLAQQMLVLTSRNGIGGANNVPTFAFTAKLTPIQETVTGTTPQKMLVKYSVVYSVVNVPSGET